jgi:hypothetical protein
MNQWEAKVARCACRMSDKFLESDGLFIFFTWPKHKRRDQVQRFETIANWHKQYGPVGPLMDLQRMGLVSKKIYPEIPPS